MAASLKSPQAQRRRDPHEKRERLLAAARKLFISPGFDKTTTKQIAETSGVSEGILFYQFGSKAGLLKELVHVYAKGAVLEFTHVRSEELTTELIVRRLIAYLEKDQEIFSLILDHASLLRENGIPTISELVVPEIENSIRLAFPKEGSLPADPSIMAQFQFSIVETACRGWLKSSSEQQKEAFIREGIRSMNALLEIKGRKSDAKLVD